ncbi:MAG TPA: hypothetical protein VFN88_00520 [Caulobacteraceae bacterium]|nr:hypothetical protein [Caulobacteraceae bacterium]
MKRWFRVLMCVAAAGLASAGARGESPYRAPRDAYGRPDLEGVWTNETLTRFERPPEYLGRPAMTAREVAALERPGVWRKVMRVGGEARTSLVTTSDGRVPPLKAGAQPDPRAWPIPAGGKTTDNPETQAIDDQCLLAVGPLAGPVMTPLPGNSHYQILQTKDLIAIEVEMIHDVRLIRLNGAHRTDGMRPWLGDSIGHFEGDTLVVETTSFPAAQWYRGSWKNLKVTERFTRVAPDRLRYQFQVDDSTKWERPWGGEYEFAARAEPIEEYACHEGEVSVEHMLDAARAEEWVGKQGGD